jgi:hypothetical protein
MATLRYVWVIHTTSTAANAGTDEGFELIIRSQVNPQAIVGTRRYPDLPHDERERGRTDQYRFDVRDLGVDMFGLNEDNFCIRILGDDAWLPASIWIIGQDVQGARRLLAGVPTWPDDLWFSTDASEGEATRCLDDPLRLIAASPS